MWSSNGQWYKTLGERMKIDVMESIWVVELVSEVNESLWSNKQWGSVHSDTVYKSNYRSGFCGGVEQRMFRGPV